MRHDRRFAAILSACFLVVQAIAMSRHIMWRDEIRTWQVCSQCSSLSSLWQAMRYEGVPVLWYWIVFSLTRISGNPAVMQIAHALIAGGVIYVLARWSPFSRLTKAIFAFGYFPLFEYGVITRNYALVFLLVMIACAMICAARMNLIALMLVLFLLTQTSIWGAGFAGILWLIAWLRTLRPKTVSWVISPVIVLTGIGLCLYECAPGPGASFVGGGWRMPGVEEIAATLGGVYRGLLPIPQMSWHFWNTNILDPFPTVEMVIGLILLVAVIALLMHQRIALIAFALGAAGLLAFSAARFGGAVRHQGQLFILLVAATWIADAFASDCQRHNAARRIFFNVLLGINLLAGIGAAIAGCVLPFSATKQAAKYIKNNFDDRVVLVGVRDWCVTPITAYLHRPIYFPEMRKLAYYNTQDDRQRYLLNREDVIEQLAWLASSSGKDVIYIRSSGEKFVDRDAMIRTPALDRLHKAMRVTVLASFNQSVVADEAQSLYLIHLSDENPLIPEHPGP